MTPLLFATALALTAPVQNPLDRAMAAPLHKDLQAPPSGIVGKPFILKDLKDLPPGAKMQWSSLQEAQAALCQKRVTQTSGPAGSTVKKLGELPPGLEEHAVNRMVDGCPVREIVSGGRTYYLDMPVAKLDRVDPTAYVPAR